MKFDITRLNNDIDEYIPIDLVYSFTPDELKGTDLLKLDDVKINGELYKNSLGNIELNVGVEGVMKLSCAITLNPVDYPFELEITGQLDELMQDLDENSKNFQNTIDIFPIIWENILMEIPMRVISDEVKDKEINMSGDGWEFTTDEEKINNPLKSLMESDMNSEVK